MDLATLVGLVLGVALILMAIALGGSFPAYVDIPSIIIVIGGAGAATLTAFPLARMLKMPSVILKAVKENKFNAEQLITNMVQYAEVARRDGILALEGITSEMSDGLLVTGIKMAVDGTDPALIEQILDADLENMQIRHDIGKGLIDAPAKYAPAFGMIGTLIGLVAMLANMDDPSAIGAGMAAALLTTLYGAVLANVVFMPIADKLAVRNEEEILYKTIIIKGVMAIQAGDNPRVVQQKLLTYLPPNGRSAGEDERDVRRAA